MKKYFSLFIISCALSFTNLHAQNPYISFSGEITYEKKINRFPRANRILNDVKNRADISSYLRSLRNSEQFDTQLLRLVFNDSTSLMNNDSSVKDDAVDMAIASPYEMYYSDINTGSITFQKSVLGESFVVVDKRQPILWKFTEEKMDILGYDCRRANGLINDSIYVVAFYCSEIPVSVGPESFYGLPGAILGISIPYENISIFATNVTLKHTEKLNPPNISTITHTLSEFRTLMETTFNQFDPNRRKEVLKSLLL